MKNFPNDRPEIDQIIYVIGNTGKEQLAVFKGGNRFDFYGTERKGYYAKWWRELDEVEQQSFDDSLPKVSIKEKRKYTKKSIKSAKTASKVKIEDNGYF